MKCDFVDCENKATYFDEMDNPTCEACMIREVENSNGDIKWEDFDYIGESTPPKVPATRKYSFPLKKKVSKPQTPVDISKAIFAMAIFFLIVFFLSAGSFFFKVGMFR